MKSKPVLSTAAAVKLPPRGKGCAVCSDTPTITELIDYEQAACDLKPGGGQE